MSTKIISTDDIYTVISASIEGAEWEEKKTKALNKLASKAKVPGFRPGKAPIEMAKKVISQTDILDEAITSSLDEMLNKALQENKLFVYSHKDVKVTKLTDTELEVAFTVINVPDVKLGTYKGLNKEIKVECVTKEEIESSINKLLENDADLVIKETPAEKGDTVILDFKGYIDGNPFDGGSADNYELVLGSGQFIPGFEDQLIGATPESKVDVNVTFPEQYVKDLAGKNAKFVCMIHEIKTKKLPELNNEFVESLNLENVKTVEDLNKHQEKTLLAQKSARQEEIVFVDILNDIIKDSKISVAPEIIAQQAADLKKDLMKQLEQSGITYEQYKEMLGSDEETINKQYSAEAYKRLSQFLTIQAIGKVEKIEVTEEDLNKYFSDVAAQYGMEIEKVKSVFEPNIDYIKNNMLQNKIERFIIDSNVVTGKKATKKTTTKKVEKTTETKEEGEKPAPKKRTTKKVATKKEENKEETK